MEQVYGIVGATFLHSHVVHYGFSVEMLYD
jgi:hypothetical protein